MSPFCIKLETYLKMAQLPYQIRPGDPMRAPKGKIPYIKDDDVKMGDSSLIIEHLSKKYEKDLDAHLSDYEKSVSHALRKMIEEHTYFYALYLRWSNEDSYRYVHEFFRPFLPKFVGPLIMKKIRKNMLNIAYAQGAARHSREEIYALMKKDLRALSQILGNRKFVMGDQPSLIDATIFAFIISQIWVPWKTEMQDYIRSLKNLEPYAERMWEKYWA